MNTDDYSSSESESECETSEYQETSPSTSCPNPKKRKRPKQTQSFVDRWLTEQQFSGWLTKRLGTDQKPQPFCKSCNKFVTCSKTGLKRHLISKSHQNRHATSTASCSTITNLFNKATNRHETSSIEIKLCAFIAEHNLPLSLAEDLVKLLRSLFPLNQTLRNVMLGKQKATNIVRQVIGFDYLHEAISALQSHSYSLIIDETTDMSTAKQLAVLTTFFDMESFEYKSFLLDMAEIVQGTAEGIYSTVKHVFAELHIPMERMIGYSSDTTNVMFGEFNSVSQLLMSEFPNVFSVKCSCHLIHLVSSYAALKLPKGLEDLVRDVYNHFHRSSKRQEVYQQFQKFYDAEPRKLLSPGQTRWLSLQLCVDRILEQYLALQHYFVLVANEDPTHSNDHILKALHNKFTLAYLEFLSHQLERTF
ncbi:uncharacterized protein LOC114531390 [Dendronephthya gigantea]|uniref:uncharacterized protein LOC114531390 n=1 Tax=Dendronephthya gigantea TaxID=151771 RepID=UPI0010692897|nr:uncharacterized protein LOC114531390 [Dendronephthya gigantea]